jgi:hypothetical protein
MLANRLWMALKKRLIDRSTPVTVVESAFTISANARPQRLGNGWLVCVVLDSGRLRLFKSTDKGESWSQLCYTEPLGGTINFSITSYNNIIHLVCNSSGSYIYYYRIDATTVTNTQLTITKFDIEASQISMGLISIAVNPLNGHLTMAWCSKNSTYPNSNNIRSAKSIDGGITWTKQSGTAGVDQITNFNTINYNFQYPCVVYKDSTLHIFAIYDAATSNHEVITTRWTGSAWVTTGTTNSGFPTIYEGGIYYQYSLCVVVSLDGTIHIVWVAFSSGISYNNIHYSKSSDNGVSWSVPILLTAVTTHDQDYPTITANKDNNLYVVFQGRDATHTSDIPMKKLIYEGGVWGSVVYVPNATDISIPVTCSNYTDFTDPLCIYQDLDTYTIKFRGKWTEE